MKRFECYKGWLLSREEVVIALFTDESNPAHLLNRALYSALQDLRESFGLTVIEITDHQGKPYSLVIHLSFPACCPQTVYANSIS